MKVISFAVNKLLPRLKCLSTEDDDNNNDRNGDDAEAGAMVIIIRTFVTANLKGTLKSGHATNEDEIDSLKDLTTSSVKSCTQQKINAMENNFIWYFMLRCID